MRERFWRTAKKAARQVPFMEEVVAAYYCALDRNTPLRAKAILLAALGYFVLPADTIPDIVLGLGFTDDVAVLTAAITAVRAHMTPAHSLAAKRALAGSAEHRRPRPDGAGCKKTNSCRFPALESLQGTSRLQDGLERMRRRRDRRWTILLKGIHHLVTQIKSK